MRFRRIPYRFMVTEALVSDDTRTVCAHAATEIQHIRLLASNHIAVLIEQILCLHEHFSIYVHTAKLRVKQLRNRTQIRRFEFFNGLIAAYSRFQHQ